jgi:RHS repeat-associated protein
LEDHLGSTNVILNSDGTLYSILTYKPWGETRSGVSSTTFKYTGQRQEKLLGGDEGLYFYGSRYYDPLLGRFISPDSMIPDPSNPADYDRYAYVRNNPVRYSDPTGHWTEEELEAALGKNWRELYFGKSGTFYGRDKLIDFLSSKNTTDPVTLDVVRSLFTVANTAHNAGVDFKNIDALGARVTLSGGGIGYGGLSGDIILNLTSGEFSGFVSPEGGFLFGEGATLVGGVTLLTKLPSNKDFRGTFKSIGVIGGFIGGVNGEGFYGGVHRGQDPNSVPNGLFFGAGGATPDSIGVNGSISYSFELLTVDQGGYHWLSNFPGPSEVLADIGNVLWNDIFHLP